MTEKITSIIDTYRKNKDVHIIAGDVNFNDDGTLGDVGNVTTMPSVNVLKIKKVSI